LYCPVEPLVVFPSGKMKITKRRGFAPLEIKISNRGNKRFLRGFTLIELLVVIAIIALLTAILVPTLARVRSQAHSLVCRSNLKTLVVAWFEYATDNDGQLCSSGAAKPVSAYNPATAGDWVEHPQVPGPMEQHTEFDHQLTREGRLRGIRAVETDKQS